MLLIGPPPPNSFLVARTVYEYLRYITLQSYPSDKVSLLHAFYVNEQIFSCKYVHVAVK